MNAKDIQDNFNLNVCNGFILYCNDKHINITKALSIKGKTTKNTVYKIARGESTYILPISIAYLCEVLNLDSPTILEQYYINNKQRYRLSIINLCDYPLL